MSSAARIQQGLGSEQLTVNNKIEHLPTHNYHIGQSVMYMNPINKRWYPAKMRSLCQEPRSYKIETDNGTIYRKTQNHLNLFQCKTDKKDEDDTQKINYDSKMSNCNNNIQIRPKYKIKVPVKLNLYTTQRCWLVGQLTKSHTKKFFCENNACKHMTFCVGHWPVGHINCTSVVNIYNVLNS